MFRKRYKDGEAGRTWEKTASDIPLLDGGGSLGQKGLTTSEVFSDEYGKKWWSWIHIYPIYPIIKV